MLKGLSLLSAVVNQGQGKFIRQCAFDAAIEKRNDSMSVLTICGSGIELAFPKYSQKFLPWKDENAINRPSMLLHAHAKTAFQLIFFVNGAQGFEVVGGNMRLSLDFNGGVVIQDQVDLKAGC